MNKKWLGLTVCIILVLSCITVFAAGTTICILPEDFEGSSGTFSVSKENAETGAFRNITLRGMTDRKPTNTIPAQVAVDIKTAGEYTVYAHTRDYSTKTGSRYFKIGIGKDGLENKKLGVHRVDGWVWEKAGSLKLEEGSYVLKIYDSSAYYARFDMIVISSDKDLKMPETSAQMQGIANKYRIVKSDAELPTYLKPNQVFKNGYFYTAATVEQINNIGTWTLLRNSWIENDTPAKLFYLNGLSGSKSPEAQNATITFAVPKGGKYWLWVRTKDFAENQGTRLFNAVVDGVTLKGDLGQHGIDGWGWERLDIGELKVGYHVLEFADNYKNYARFDMFLITDDHDFVPENKQVSACKLLSVAKFSPEEVVPDIVCPVKAEPLGENVTALPVRPATENAVSVNGTYIECKSDFSGKQPMVSAKTVFMALGGTVNYETEDSICFEKNGKQYLFYVGDTFCYNGKKKIEMRSEAVISKGEIMIPASFLSKLEHVKVKTNGKDVEITHKIWK